MAIHEVDLTEYNGEQLYVVTIAFLVITFATVLLRCYVRIAITKEFAIENWLMIGFTITCVFVLLGIHYGIGRHQLALPLENQIQALKYQVLLVNAYIPTMCLIKLSVATFLLYFTVKKLCIYTLKMSMVFVTVWSLAIWIYDTCKCVTVAGDMLNAKGKCVSQTSYVAAVSSTIVMTIVTDWLFALLPVPIVWSLHMSRRAKVTVSVVLGMGILASIAALIRLGYSANAISTTDPLFDDTPAFVWTIAEPGLAITAASLGTIRPILRALGFLGFEHGVGTVPQVGQKNGVQLIERRGDEDGAAGGGKSEDTTANDNLLVTNTLGASTELIHVPLDKERTPKRMSCRSALEPLMNGRPEFKSETPVGRVGNEDERVGDSDESGVLGPWKFGGSRAHLALESGSQHELGDGKRGKTDTGYLGASERPSADLSWLDATYSDES